MLSAPILVRKINNAKHEVYVKKKFNEETNNRDTRHTKEILDSFKFRKLKDINPRNWLSENGRFIRHVTTRRWLKIYDTTRRWWRTSKIGARRNYCWESKIKSSQKKKIRTGLKILTPNNY